MRNKVAEIMSWLTGDIGTRVLLVVGAAISAWQGYWWTAALLIGIAIAM